MTPLFAVASAAGTDPLAMRLTLPAPAVGTGSFADILGAGLRHVEGKLASADALVRRFALDDEVPVHQVSFALEQNLPILFQ